MNKQLDIYVLLEAIDNLDDYARMSEIVPIGDVSSLRSAIYELEQLRNRVTELESLQKVSESLIKKQEDQLQEQFNVINYQHPKQIEEMKNALLLCEEAITELNYCNSTDRARELYGNSINKIYEVIVEICNDY